jgi:phosphoribosylaminoimidazolecarboxamide formyltransferase/IMP cyclohydrolase
MQQAFAHTAAYDGAIATWLTARAEDGSVQAFPHKLFVSGDMVQQMRYGENPHQRAALYREGDPPRGSIAAYRQLQGKELSFNNLVDADAAWRCVAAFDAPTCVIVKHANPCGVASAPRGLDAYRAAFATDPVSAFGGIIAFNRSVEASTVEALAEQFVEVVIAPGYEADALPVIARKKNVRVLQVPLPGNGREELDFKHVGGGFSCRPPTRATSIAAICRSSRAWRRPPRKSTISSSPGVSPGSSNPTRSSIAATIARLASAPAR